MEYIGRIECDFNLRTKELTFNAIMEKMDGPNVVERNCSSFSEIADAESFITAVMYIKRMEGYETRLI